MAPGEGREGGLREEEGNVRPDSPIDPLYRLVNYHGIYQPIRDHTQLVRATQKAKRKETLKSGNTIRVSDGFLASLLTDDNYGIAMVALGWLS